MADRALSLLVKFAALDRLTGPLRNIRGGSRQAASALADTRREVAALQRAQARIGSFKAVETRMRADAAALAAARARVDELKTAISNADGPTKRLTASLGRAEGQVRRLEARTEGQGQELQDLSRKLESAGIDVADLARHEDRLGLKLRDSTRLLKQQEDQLARTAAAREKMERNQQLGASLRSGGTRAVAGGLAIGAPVIAAAKSAADFQSSMTDIAQKADLTRAAGDRMGKSLDALGPKVGQLPSQLAEGVDALAGFGLDPKQAMQMIAPIGKAATAYKAEVLDLGKATFSAVDNLKVPVRETARVLDVMAQAGKDGAFEVKDMAQFFPELTASASSLGQRGVPAVADLAAALQIARKGAGDSATAANNLQNLLAKINTKDTIKNFKAFGVDVPAGLKKAAKDGKSPIEAIVEMTKKATGGDLSKLSFLFGDMQVQQALRPLVENIDLYRKIRAEALAANGTVERDFAERMKDVNAQAQRLEARTQSLGHRLGNVLLPYVAAVMDKVGVLADRFSAWADRNPTLAATLIKVAAGAAILLVVLGGLAIGLGAIIGPFAILRFQLTLLGPLFMTVVRGISAAGAFLVANPLVAGILALVAVLAFAGYMIWKHWDTIKTAFMAAWTWIRALAGKFWEAGAAIMAGLVDGITAKVAAIKSTILGIGTKVAGWFRGVLGIHSPSRVFMGFGNHIAAGLALGIEQGGDAPVRRLGGIARRMASAVTAGAPAVAMAGAGIAGQAVAGATGAAPVTINVYGAPGQSPTDLAEAVRKAFDEHRRTEAAAARSSYRDEDND